MSVSVIEYLRHIQDEADFLRRALAGIERDAFVADETLQRA